MFTQVACIEAPPRTIVDISFIISKGDLLKVNKKSQTILEKLIPHICLQCQMDIHFRKHLQIFVS